MNKEIYEKVVEADSVRLLEIVMDVEEEFDIELDDEKLSALKNVEDVVNEIERAQGK